MTGISDTGVSVGFSITGGVTNGFANLGGIFNTVDDPGFAFTQLLGISNNSAMAAGYWTHDVTGLTGQLAGFVEGGPGFISPTFDGVLHSSAVERQSQATGVNDGGWLVGFYQEGPNSSPTFTGFLDKSGVISLVMAPRSHPPRRSASTTLVG